MKWLRDRGAWIGLPILPMLLLLANPRLFFTALAVIAVAGLITWAFRATANPSGVQFLGPVLAAGARCLVCRSELDGEIIKCASCHTPHHRECFTYAGACSVYACRGRKAA